jgi:hypothetical protein
MDGSSHVISRRRQTSEFGEWSDFTPAHLEPRLKLPARQGGGLAHREGHSLRDRPAES